MTSPTLRNDWLVLDAGPLIQLDRLGYVDLLPRIYDRLLLPPTVAAELRRGGDRPGSRAPGRTWLEHRAPLASVMGRIHQDLRAGAGEREALALALELGATVALDDLKARRYARRIGVSVTGTLGLLLEIHGRDLAGRTIEEDLDRLAAGGMHLTERLRVMVIEAAEKGAS